MKNSLRVLGIDPGLDRTGWAVLEKQGTAGPFLIESGLIHTPAGMPFPARLESVFRQTEKIIKDFSPSCIALEEMYFMKRASSVSATIQTRGVILLAGQLAGVETFSYQPRKVKAVAAGNGDASKQQMQRMTQLVLNLKQPLTPDDVADAAAIAICHIKTAPFVCKMKEAAKKLLSGKK